MYTFKVYPFGKSKNVPDKKSWWTVHVLKSPEEMRTYMRTHKCKRCKNVPFDIAGPNHKETRGLTHSHSYRQAIDLYGNVDGKKGESGEFGIIFLNKKHAIPEVISHECSHATYNTVKRMTQVVNFDSPCNVEMDEQWAYLLSGLVRQVTEGVL